MTLNEWICIIFGHNWKLRLFALVRWEECGRCKKQKNYEFEEIDPERWL